MSGGPHHTWPSTITDDNCPWAVDESPWRTRRCGRATKHTIVTVEGASVKVCGIHKNVVVRRGLANRYDFIGGGS